MKKIKSISIGIPAHNEEKNLANLLDSIFSQKITGVKLEKIIIALDGCTDDTEKIVKKYKSKHSIIKIINDKKRFGKAQRVNQIYKLNKSDLLIMLDADLVISEKISIQKAIQEFKNNKKISLLALRQIPVWTNSLMGNASVLSYLIYENSFLNYNFGNNIYSLQGAAYVIKKSLSKKITYPKNTIADHKFLYMQAIEKTGRGSYQISNESKVFFRTISTFNDWRLQGTRSVFSDIENINSIYGEKVKKEYQMPKKLYKESVIKFLMIYPLETIIAVFMNLLIRVFPKKRNKSGAWELAKSSKLEISLSTPNQKPQYSHQNSLLFRSLMLVTMFFKDWS